MEYISRSTGANIQVVWFEYMVASFYVNYASIKQYKHQGILMKSQIFMLEMPTGKYRGLYISKGQYIEPPFSTVYGCLRFYLIKCRIYFKIPLHHIQPRTQCKFNVIGPYFVGNKRKGCLCFPTGAAIRPNWISHRGLAEPIGVEPTGSTNCVPYLTLPVF